MNKSIWMAIVAVIAVALWLLSGRFADRGEDETAVESAVNPVMSVEVIESQAKNITREIVVQGKLEPLRKVDLRAETPGMVKKLHAEKGDRVGAGQVLLELWEKDRQAQILKAEAEIASKQLQVDGMRHLNRRGLQSDTMLKQAQAELAAAHAEKKRLQLDLADTTIRAPFSAVVETRPAELGSYVEVGDSVAGLIDVSRLKAVAFVAQQESHRLHVGQPVRVRLLDGREAPAELVFIAREADDATRSFRIEAEFDNAAGLPAGLSAELRIAVGDMPAHFLTPAALTLDENGRLGVKVLDINNRVVFKPTKIVRTETLGVWLSGLDGNERVVSRGQGFVLPGETVRPVVRQAE